MEAWILLVSGSSFVAFGGSQLAGSEQPSWISVPILPGGLVMVGLGLLGLLVPGFL